MVGNLKYAIMAFLFVGAAKLIQVTIFDSEQYNKNKNTNYSKSVPSNNPEVATKEKSKKLDPETPVSPISEDTPPPVLDRTEGDSLEMEYKEDLVPEKKDDVIEEAPTTSLKDLKNSYLAPIISKLPPGQLREDIVIRYYRHDKDGEKVYVLRDLNYYIHEKEATETAGYGSNVLYYGEGVNINDIRIVALTLLENEIGLKSIQRSRFDWKSNSLEIGTNPNLTDKSIITKDYVFSFTK